VDGEPAKDEGASVSRLEIPPGQHRLEFQYAGLSYAAPEKVRFKHRLDGLDADWIEAGTRRAADYNYILPGNYTFHVIACNNDGVWNETGASITFVIAAAWYQSPWFRCLCAFAILVGLWSLYAARLAMATATINTRLNERLMERERIARELHDTLLQGFHGVMLRFQAVLNQIPADQRAHVTMEKALRSADDVLLEGRERVRDLRFESFSDIELQEALEACGREYSQHHAIAFNLTTSGAPQALRPIVQDESLQIGREAIVNAFTHSHASTIEVEMTYARSGFQLKVRDNGDGIDPKIVEHGRPGHWGLLGMRERASQVGGQLHISSSQGAGVEIDFTIPANVAYLPESDERIWQKLKRLVKWRRSAR
jgi:signal transduction histidine kinase